MNEWNAAIEKKMRKTVERREVQKKKQISSPNKKKVFHKSEIERKNKNKKANPRGHSGVLSVRCHAHIAMSFWPGARAPLTNTKGEEDEIWVVVDADEEEEEEEEDEEEDEEGLRNSSTAETNWVW